MPTEIPQDQTPRKTLAPHEDFEQIGDVRYYHRLEQDTDEWHQLRLGMLTASTMNRVLTPTLKVSAAKEAAQFLYDLAADRITQRIEPGYVSWDMERGKVEEVEARILYEKHFGRTAACGFVINDSLGFPIGFSPDFLIGDDGFAETKSRAPRFQVKTVIEHMVGPFAGTGPTEDTPLIPPEYMIQVQTGLFVTGRAWCDFLSYSNGVNMLAIRVEPIEKYQDAIQEAATVAEKLEMVRGETAKDLLRGARRPEKWAKALDLDASPDKRYAEGPRYRSHQRNWDRQPAAQSALSYARREHGEQYQPRARAVF